MEPLSLNHLLHLGPLAEIDGLWTDGADGIWVSGTGEGGQSAWIALQFSAAGTVLASAPNWQAPLEGGRGQSRRVKSTDLERRATGWR